MGAAGSEESDAEEHGGRRLAGTVGAAAAAGASITGAQSLLGLDAAEAATGEDGTVDSVVPLGDAPLPDADTDVDLDHDVDAFLSEDATVGLSDPPGDPLDDDLGVDPVGDAFATGHDPAAAFGSHEDLGETDLDPFDGPDAIDEPDAVEVAFDL